MPAVLSLASERRSECSCHFFLLLFPSEMTCQFRRLFLLRRLRRRLSVSRLLRLIDSEEKSGILTIHFQIFAFPREHFVILFLITKDNSRCFLVFSPRVSFDSHQLKSLALPLYCLSGLSRCAFLFTCVNVSITQMGHRRENRSTRQRKQHSVHAKLFHHGSFSRCFFFLCSAIDHHVESERRSAIEPKRTP